MTTRTPGQRVQRPSMPLVGAPVSIEAEVVIEIRPRDYVRYSGTSAQLQAEGVLPPDFGLDAGSWEAWEAAGFEYTAKRCRPDGMSAATWRASSRDHWAVTRRRIDPVMHPLYAGRIYEAAQALQHSVWLTTEAAEQHRRRVLAARSDDGFRALLRAVTQRQPR